MFLFRMRVYLISLVFFIGISFMWYQDFSMRLRFNMLLRDSTRQQEELKAAAKRIAALSDTITELMSIGGTVGVALGVLHHGEAITTQAFGYRHAEKRLAIDEQTVFAGASLTKAVVSAAMGILVEDEKVGWDSLIKDVLPEFTTLDTTLGNLTTITDILSHRTGMSTSNYWLGSSNNVLIDKTDSMKFLNNQCLVKPFRGQFQYNNLGYEIAGHIIDELTGKPWSEFIHEKVLRPLELRRTSFKAGTVQDDNVSEAYATLDDGTASRIPGVKMDDAHFGGANGGIRTCLKDLLRLYSSLLREIHAQFRSNEEGNPKSSLKQVARLISSNIALEHKSLHEQSYALGWVRAQLPGPMGAIGLNPKLMPQGMPVVGKGVPSRLVLYHQGSLPGVLAAVSLVPETRSAIVVLTNSLALNDCADWISQAVLEALLDVKQKNNYIELAKQSRNEALSWHSKLSNEIDAERSGDPPPRPLSDYVGTFENNIQTMKIIVSITNERLSLAFQGLGSERFSLEHIRDDEFSWLQSRDKLAKRGRFTHQSALYYKIRFHVTQAKVTGLSWTHDADVPEGEMYSLADF